MQEHRKLYKIFKELLKEERKKTLQDKNITRAIMSTNDIWKIYGRIKRSKSKSSNTYSDEEQRNIKTWWSKLYEADNNLIPVDIPHRKEKLDPIEINTCIKLLGNNKASGPDGIPCELIKHGGTATQKMLF